MVWLYPKGTLSAQTGITGNAEVVLQVEGVDCNDLAPIIGVYVDVTGFERARWRRGLECIHFNIGHQSD